MTLTEFLGLYNYWIVIFLMMTGFYIVISSTNLIKTVIGLNIFQTSVVLLYITMGKVSEKNGGQGAPILKRTDEHGHSEHGVEHATEIADAAKAAAGHAGETGAEHASDAAAGELGHSAEHAGDAVQHVVEGLYTNPLPSVLMLTAIVVGIATTALALALIVRIREDYGSIEEDDILELDRDAS